MLVKEVWKDIKGYEGLYQVSNLGNVKKLKTLRNNRYNKPTWDNRPKILKPWDNGFGYKVVSLEQDKKRKNYYVHRLVAEHFIPNVEGKSQVNHKDYNKSNNQVDNLEWVTAKENTNWSKPNFAKHHICKTNTGFRYIIFRATKNVYRVIIDKKEKSFKTLEEAKIYRDKIISERGEDFGGRIL